MNSLKKLLPSLILIAIYFITDELFGSLTGMICAFFLGIGEFLYTRIKEKRNDKIILLTTLVFCIPGLLNLFTDNRMPDQLQSVIIEAGTCLLLGILAFSKINMLETLPATYRKTVNLDPVQEKVMKKSLKTLFYLLCIHLLIATAALLYTQGTITTFICTTLLYILLACYFIATFIHNSTITNKFRHEEWLPVVNETGEVCGKAPRSICHSGSKLLHPVVHLHIPDEEGRIFLQKRSLKKKLLPGKWDTAVGGHVGINEEIKDALKRESFEELGITGFNARFIGSYIWESPREKELVFSFLCTNYDRIAIANDEVDEGRFWTKEEIENNLSNDLFTPNFLHEYNQYLTDIVK